MSVPTAHINASTAARIPMAVISVAVMKATNSFTAHCVPISMSVNILKILASMLTDAKILPEATFAPASWGESACGSVCKIKCS